MNKFTLRWRFFLTYYVVLLKYVWLLRFFGTSTNPVDVHITAIRGTSQFDGWTNLPNSSITSIRFWAERLIWQWKTRTKCNLHWFHLRSTPSRGGQLLGCYSRPPSSLNFRLQVIRILGVRAHQIALTGWILPALFFGITKLTLTKNSSMIFFFSFTNKQ
jgi:hypothetical protein